MDLSSPTLANRLSSKMTPEGECWVWTGHRNSDGYGRVRTSSRVGAKVELVHRVMFTMFVGAIPEGMVVMHTCDNRACGNPDHLRIGTQADNLADMTAKGRRFSLSLRRNRGDALSA